MDGSRSTRLTPKPLDGRRAALVIATTRYEDPELSQLRAPARDAEGLAEVLGDPDIGAFTLTKVIDADERQVRREIDGFLSGRGVGDLVVLYLSCHGVLDRRNRLYFAAADTLKGQLGSTAIPSAWLLDQLDECRARRQVLILDCCFSGAFAQGSKGDTDLDLERRLAGQGRGRAVLTASRAGEYSFEGQALPDAEVVGSVFTDGLLEGLQTGAADISGDGYVSVDEAFDYAYSYVLARGANQTPQRWLYGGEGTIVLARSPAGIAVIPAQLPELLASSLDSPYPALRIGAVNTLGDWLSGSDPAKALTAEQKLRQIAASDVATVAAAARAYLSNLQATEMGGSNQEALAALSTPPRNSRLTATQQVHGDHRPPQVADRIASGIGNATKLIARTLGPMGRKCVVRDQSGSDVEASDAKTIVDYFVPEDPRDVLGATFVREMVREQELAAHDGAATAAVLAHAMTVKAVDALRAGVDPMSLKRGIEATVERVSEELSKLAKDVETKEEIASLITTSTGDAAIGEVIAEALDKVGKEGVITVEDSNTFGLELELTEGMRFDKGYISPQFHTESEGMEAVLEDPYILIVGSKVSANKDLLPVLDKVAQSGKPLVIIAEDVEGEALATLVVNKIRGRFKSVAVRAPGFGNRRKAILGDIAILTGGYVISEEVGLKLESADLDLLGRARKVVVTKDETTIVDGAGDPEQISDRINQIRAEIDNTDSDYDREKLQERLAKLAGGAAVIKVGALTETALYQRKQLTESAVAIARESITWGLLPGGGTALMEVQRRLGTGGKRRTSGQSLVPDQLDGAAIVSASLAEPLKQILANAGIDPAKLAKPISSWIPATGLDVITNEHTDMARAGIIDSCWVVTQAVANAAKLTERLLLVS
jgi:chaperonin GroEL